MEEIRVVMLEARPLPNSKESEQVAGAFVNVYSTATSDAEALDVAKVEVDQAGWSIVSVEDQYLLTRAEAQADPDCLPYYEQALLDGIVLVFHTYPPGGEVNDVAD